MLARDWTSALPWMPELHYRTRNRQQGRPEETASRLN
jgi:hypothetical protein